MHISSWHMPCTIPCLCPFSGICFFLQKSLLLYFCLLKFPFLSRPSTNTGLPMKLFQILAYQRGLPLWTVHLRIASCRCLSFAVNTHRHTKTYTHRHRHTCTHIGTTDTRPPPNRSTSRAGIAFYFSGVFDTHKMPWTVKPLNIIRNVIKLTQILFQ